MADQLMMRGFWGPRQESAEGLAERLSAFCGRLGELFPGGAKEWLDAQEVAAPLASPDGARAFVEQRFAKLSEGEAELGVVLVASAEYADGTKLTFNASVGGFSELRTLKNNVVLKVDLPSGASAQDCVLIARECFAVLLREWEPDWADVTSHELWDAIRGTVQVKSRTPRAGFVTYLSSGRKVGVPAGIAAQSVETSGGGILIGSVTDKEFLTPAQVADIDNALRPTPAFEPVPTDRSRL
ncbi:Imm52 family immunity protein [Streptomyces sp. NPDC059837]|uniref:Imm52 family immunity protein n=1 Tax=unclassified Streptomyces TaxID=2593676 RepID=UPI0022569B4A|nr:Imm52 family immunity protein [Streptomyces sp. NBC_00268]MCX5186793.1 immunity 52 family protein [Streptomyces sp. NBC_00268]